MNDKEKPILENPATGAVPQDSLDAFLRKNLGPVPEGQAHHEKRMLSLIANEQKRTSRRIGLAALPANPWAGGLMAAAAALSLYVWNCSAQRSIIADAPVNDLAAAEILLNSFDEVDEMTSVVPQSYLSQ